MRGAHPLDEIVKGLAHAYADRTLLAAAIDPKVDFLICNVNTEGTDE